MCSSKFEPLYDPLSNVLKFVVIVFPRIFIFCPCFEQPFLLIIERNKYSIFATVQIIQAPKIQHRVSSLLPNHVVS